MSRPRPTLIPPRTAPPDYESQVRANILASPFSTTEDIGTIADLELPFDFLGRLADRALRASYYEHFRAIVADSAAPAAATSASPHATPAPPASTSPATVS